MSSTAVLRIERLRIKDKQKRKRSAAAVVVGSGPHGNTVFYRGGLRLRAGGGGVGSPTCCCSWYGMLFRAEERWSWDVLPGPPSSRLQEIAMRDPLSVTQKCGDGAVLSSQTAICCHAPRAIGWRERKCGGGGGHGMRNGGWKKGWKCAGAFLLQLLIKAHSVRYVRHLSDSSLHGAPLKPTELHWNPRKAPVDETAHVCCVSARACQISTMDSDPRWQNQERHPGDPGWKNSSLGAAKTRTDGNSIRICVSDQHLGISGLLGGGQGSFLMGILSLTRTDPNQLFDWDQILLIQWIYYQDNYKNELLIQSTCFFLCYVLHFYILLFVYC